MATVDNDVLGHRIKDYKKGRAPTAIVELACGHIAGKAHESMAKRNNITADDILKEFQTSASNWIDPEIKGSDLITLWSSDELSSLGFKYRETCLHPSPVIKDLTPYQKARVYRYIRDFMGVGYYTEMAAIMAAVDNDVLGHIRIKELFESCESYKWVCFPKSDVINDS